jgi:hypothetical protein
MTPFPAPTSHPKEAMSATNRDPSSESSGASMDLMSLVRLTVRHWRVTGPAAAATLLLVVAAFVLSSPSYAASASVALYSPPEAPDAAETPGADPSVGQNPFTRYGDLSVVADIVARRMNSDAERAELEAEGVTGYEVVANRLQRGPLVEVTGTGPNPAAAISSAEVVVAEFDSVLSEMQEAEGADPDYFITSGPIEPPETAVAQVGSTIRFAIAALAVGALGTLGLAVLAESVIRRRAAAQNATAVPAENAGAGKGTDLGNDRKRAPAGGPRAAIEAGGPGNDRQGAPSGGRRTATKRGERNRPGSAKRSESVLEAEVEQLAQPPQQERTRWLPLARESTSDNGHKKPTTDRSP